MQYHTKNQRLNAISEVWMKKHKRSSFSTREVAQWALAARLFPVPKRGDPETECQAWESRLAEVE